MGKESIKDALVSLLPILFFRLNCIVVIPNSGISIFQTSRRNENWFEKWVVREIGSIITAFDQGKENRLWSSHREVEGSINN